VLELPSSAVHPVDASFQTDQPTGQKHAHMHVGMHIDTKVPYQSHGPVWHKNYPILLNSSTQQRTVFHLGMSIQEDSRILKVPSTERKGA